MRVEIDPYNKTQKGTLVACALVLAFFLVMLVGAIVDRDPLLIVAMLFGAALFAWILRNFMNPREWNCVSAVKDDMGYRELKQAVSRERFDEPIRFVQRDYLKFDSLGVSQNWLVIGKGEGDTNPVCIPKDKVASIEVQEDDLGCYDNLYGGFDDYLYHDRDTTAWPTRSGSCATRRTSFPRPGGTQGP